MTSNLDRFRAIDDAYNARDWNAYSALLDDTFRGWMQSVAAPQGKAEHVRAAKEFCAISADNRVHNDPYVAALSDGAWTCTIARLTGTMTGPLPTSDGTMFQPTKCSFDTSFATIARWVGGKIVEEFEFLDNAGIMRQIGATK
jgi:SnoaL-like polyketide cyclase